METEDVRQTEIYTGIHLRALYVKTINRNTMKRKARGISENGSLYDCMFENPASAEEIALPKADHEVLIKSLPEQAFQYTYQANRIAMVVRDMDGDIFRTCQNLWKFLYRNISFDPNKKERNYVRSIYQVWKDREADSESFAFFISSVLTLLHIPHELRMSEQEDWDDETRYLYVVVQNNGSEICIDPTQSDFDCHPSNNIKTDTIVRNLFPEDDTVDIISEKPSLGIDARDLLSYQINPGKYSGINLDNQFTQNYKANSKNENEKISAEKKQPIETESIHLINRINPSAILRRLGILVGMKLNLFGTASEIRYAYLTDEEAKKRGFNMKRYFRYKKVREKMESIFFNSGGDLKNLKDSVLNGKGNIDKAVHISGQTPASIQYSSVSKLKEIIGDEIFSNEIPAELFEEFSKINTVSTTNEAANILAGIGGVLKNVGSIRETGEPGTDQSLDNLDRQAGVNGKNENHSSNSLGGTESSESNDKKGTQDKSESGANESEKSSEQTEKSFFDKAKDWAIKNQKPLMIAGSVIGVAVFGFIMYKKISKRKEDIKRKEEEKAQRDSNLNGFNESPTNGKKGKKYKESKADKILRDIRLMQMMNEAE